MIAVAENGVIGRDNGLPWRLKTDLRRFRELTWGKPMIMGRRSWESIGRALPSRETVVVTRQPGYAAEGAHVAHDFADARSVAAELAGRMRADEVAVVGGVGIFRAALPEADIIHLTRVHASPPGDVVMPPIDESGFETRVVATHGAGPDDDWPFTFLELRRKSTAAALVAGR